MARSIYVREAGGFINFKDTATDAEITSYLKAKFPAPAPTTAAVEAPTEVGPDESGVLGRFAYGLGTGLTDVPGGIAALMYPAEEAAKTSAGQFSEGARKYLQETFGIDPTKDPTAAQQAAEALGSVASFLIPGTGVAKGASLLGKGAALAGRAAAVTAGAQGVALGAGQRAQTIQQQLAAGMEIPESTQLAAQRLDGLIGASEATPINKFFGPLTTLLSKVPVSKAPILERIVESRLGSMTRAGLEEGAQEVASGIASDIMEYGVYNPDVEIGQDLLSNAGTGAFAGSFVEGVIQLAAGRKLRPYRQLQQDLGTEAVQNAESLRQGKISQTAEELRQYNVEGPVDVTEEEVDGITKYTIKSPAGNSFGRFDTPEEASSAVDLYSRATGAKVRVKQQPSEAVPEVLPIKIGKKKYGSFDEIRAARDTAVASREAAAKFVTDPDLLKTQAEAKKVPEELYRRKMFEEVQKQDKIIGRLDAYLPETKTEEAAPPAPVKTISKAIPYDTVSYDKTKGKVYSSGEAPVIDYGGRKIVIKNINGVDVPFYLSSGLGGKKGVPAGKWYPFFGIGKGDGWINKTSSEEMANYYGVPEFRVAAEELDAEFGDIRNDASIPKVAPEGRHIDYLNEGFDPADNQAPDTLDKVRANIDATVARIRTAEPPPAVANPVEPPIGSVAPPKEEISTEPPVESEAVRADEAKPEVVQPQRTAPPPEPRPFTPEYKAKMDKVYEALSKDLDKIAPPEVKLKLVELVQSKPGLLIRGVEYGAKTETGVERVIELSRGIFDPNATVEDMVKRMTEDLNHEIIHALRNMGLFRKAEWNVLSKSALNAKVPKKSYTYLDRANAIYRPNGIPIAEVYASDEALIEEAIADMYKDWVKNRQAPQQAQGLLNRVTEFFRRIFRALKSTQHEEVFKSIEAGKLREREASPAQEVPKATTEERFSAAPAVESEEFRKWFSGSKAVNPDGTPKVFYHGTPFSFKEFGKGRSASLSGETGPFYFSDSPKFASQYAETAFHAGGGGKDIKKGGRMIPVYLSVKNPFDADNPEHLKALIPKIREGVASGRIEPKDVLGWKDFDAVERAVRTKTIAPMDVLVDDEINKIDRVLSSGGWYNIENRAVQKAIRDLGFDGFYVKESGFKNLAVYRPQQVKSTFNQFEPGTAKSPRFSAAPVVNSEEFKRWFRNSGVVDGQGKPMIVYHHGSFTEDGNFVPRTPMHFGTISAAKERAFGKRTDDAISAVSAYKNDEGLWHWDDGQGYTSEDAGEPGYVSERNAIKAGQTDVLNRDDYSELEAEDVGTIVPVYLSLQKMKRVPDVGGANGEWDAEIEKAKAEGYDGIVYKNLYEDKGSNSFIAFYPQQVKSPDSRFSPEKEDIRFSAAPLPPYVEQKNRTLFRPTPDRSFFETVTDFFTGPAITDKTLSTTAYGNIVVSKGTRRKLAFKTSVVDKNAIVEFLEKIENQKKNGEFEFSTADESAVFSLMMKDRASQLTASNIMMGGIGVKYTRPGDIQSATLAVDESPDNLLEVFKVLMKPGAPDPVTGKLRDNREVFKSYAVAMRAIGLKAAGEVVPRELDNTYINTVISFTRQNYPEVVEAYEMYQRVNKKVLVALRDSGRISDAELANLSRRMDYYGFFREVYSEELVPGVTSKTAGKIQLREYTGSERGNLIDDPMFVMISNMQFLIDSMAKNIAATKVFNLAKNMGEARLLGASEQPNQDIGESSEVMFFHDKGVLKRFAVKDPMLVKVLGADDRADVGGAMKLLGLPTSIIRESITRDPAFLIANLLRDTLSSWITSGEDIMPFIGTAKGVAESLKQGTSFKALMGRGAVGSYDLAMKGPAELAATIQRRLAPVNVHMITDPKILTSLIGHGWDRLGVWSEASDAATRVAIYESARKQGLSEAEATFRAIKIMDFSRRGSSAFLGILTKLVPFLNARIQGLDVLYQAGAAAYRVSTGKALSERDANLGKKFLVRGAMLMAVSLLLEKINDGDEPYEELPDYVKKSNILIPMKLFGVDGGQFIAIPKPFEAGLLFSTIPQQMYKTLSGDASARDNIGFFVDSFASTFAVNPIPQIALPALEIIVNHDFYTGLPLISEGKARLSPELQYDSRTSTLARMLGNIPIKYNLTTGRFEGISPIVIDQLIGGYAGPFGTLMVSAVGMAMEGVDVGPERLPRAFSEMPVIKRFFVDAESRSPKTVAQAYELFRIVDEANRSFSRLRQTGDAEAVMDYLDENRDVLKYKKYVYKLVDSLNKLSAHERQIERDKTMTDVEKREAMNRLREVRKRLTAKVGEINKALGR